MKRYKPIMKNTYFDESLDGEWLKFDEVVSLIMKMNNVNEETSRKWIRVFKK
jgi:hypothetical protein